MNLLFKSQKPEHKRSSKKEAKTQIKKLNNSCYKLLKEFPDPIPSSSNNKLQMEQLLPDDYDSFFFQDEDREMNSSKKAIIKQELFANYQVENFRPKLQKFDDAHEDKFAMSKSLHSNYFHHEDQDFDDLNLEKTLSMGFQAGDYSLIKEEDPSMVIREDKSIDSFKMNNQDLKNEKQKLKYENNSSGQKYPFHQNRYQTEGNKKIKKRGRYKICTLDKKMEAIRMARIKTIKEASDMLEIPEKNIKRWIKNGPERKKGAGRKTMDPNMERNLLNWVANEFSKKGEFPDNKEIKNQAKIFSNQEKFKASKGWCDKFLRRNQRYFEMLKKNMQQNQCPKQNNNGPVPDS